MLSLKNCRFIYFFLLLQFLSFDFLKGSENEYKYQIAAYAMFQNEAEWLKEWIEYHKLIGVEHFYLFDNGSTDNFREILKPYIKKGVVDLYHYPHVGQTHEEFLAIQYHLNMQAIKLAKHKAKWLAIIDLDEFIVPLQTNSLEALLEKYENYGGLYANWLMFGTSNVQKIPQGCLMIEALDHCAVTPVPVGKSIVRPERVSKCTHPHYMKYKAPYFHVNTNHQTFEKENSPIVADQLLIYHYYTRDIDHLINVKLPRRKKWMNFNEAKYVKDMDIYNACLNFDMWRFIPYLDSAARSKQPK